MTSEKDAPKPDDFFVRIDDEDVTIMDLAASHPDLARSAWDVLTAALRAGTRADLGVPPQQVAGYEIKRELGRGGMGVVFEATDPQLGRPVALKIMNQSAFAGTASLERFRREATTTSRLDDPGICKVYGTGTEHGIPYIAMQLIEGITLARRIKTTSVPTQRDEILEIARIVEEAARSLDKAHEAGVIHRDVKPGNIMIGPGARPVILDFGLARTDDADLPTLTREGDVFGTPAYMSPERLKSDGIIDRRCDVYALGVLLFEALAHERPLKAATQETLFRTILEVDPPPLDSVNEAVPSDLSVVAQVAMEKNPDRRYATAAALADDLARVRRREPIHARPPSWIGRIVRWIERRPSAAALIAVIVLAISATSVLGGRLIADWPRIREAERQAALERMELQLERGFLAFNEQRLRNAIDAFTPLLSDPRLRTEATFGLALTYLRGGDPAAALEQLDGAPEETRAGTAFRLLRADALRAIGREDEAQAAAADLPHPSTALDHFLVGLRLISNPEREQRELGLRQITRAALLAPRARTLYHLHRAQAALLLGDRDLMRQCDHELRRLWPSSAHTWLFHAFMLGGAPFARPRRSGELVHVTAGDGAQRHFEPNFEGALEAYNKVLSIEPDSTSAILNKGVVLQKLNRKDEAMQHFEEATHQLPGQVLPWFNLGLAKNFADDRMGAMATWKRALEIDPTHVLTLRALAIAHRGQGDNEEARRLMDRALKEDPTDAATLTWSGVLYMDAQNPAGAERAWRDAVKHDPNDLNANRNLGNLLKGAGEVEEAADFFAKALALGGYRELPVALAAARCFARSDRIEAAIATLEKTVAQVGEDPRYPKAQRDQLRAALAQLKRRGG